MGIDIEFDVTYYRLHPQLVHNKEYNCHFCSFMLQTKKYVTYLFLSDFHDFFPKCRALYVVLEKGLVNGEKGHDATEKGHCATSC